MRIGFDAKRLFCNFTGLGNYSRTLLQNLAQYFPENEYHLYTPRIENNKKTQPFLKHSNYRVHLPGTLLKALWRSYSMVSDLKSDHIELYHGLSHEIPMGLSKSKIKSIVSIHDLIFKIHPETYNWPDQQIYDFKFRYACENADKIVAISESTKRDIIHHYQIDPDRIEVIYQSCAPIFYDTSLKPNLRPELEIPSPYLLFVGSVERRKNLELIIKAYRHLPEDLRIPLVIVGKAKSYQKKIAELIKNEKLEQLIIWRSNIQSKADLKALYLNAEALVYPSLYEGFGLPVAEALLCKTPVITSDISALPEAGGPDTQYIDPFQEEDLSEAIRKVLTDSNLNQKMRENGFEYASEKFSPEQISKQMMRLYQKTIRTD